MLGLLLLASMVVIVGGIAAVTAYKICLKDTNDKPVAVVAAITAVVIYTVWVWLFIVALQNNA